MTVGSDRPMAGLNRSTNEPTNRLTDRPGIENNNKKTKKTQHLHNHTQSLIGTAHSPT
jgi:hypothetical protein